MKSKYIINQPTTIWWVEDGILTPTWIYNGKELDHHLKVNGDRGFLTINHGFLTVKEDMRLTARDHPEIMEINKDVE